VTGLDACGRFITSPLRSSRYAVNDGAPAETRLVALVEVNRVLHAPHYLPEALVLGVNRLSHLTRIHCHDTDPVLIRMYLPAETTIEVQAER